MRKNLNEVENFNLGFDWDGFGSKQFCLLLELPPRRKVQTAFASSGLVVFCGPKMGHQSSRQMAAFHRLVSLPEDIVPIYQQILSAGFLFSLGILKEWEDAYREGYSTKDVLVNLIGIASATFENRKYKMFCLYDQEKITLNLYMKINF